VTKLQQLCDEQRQSPSLDNLTGTYLRDGTLARYVLNGIRGVTANPTIFTKAIEGSHPGVDMEDVGLTLEDHGVAGFHDSFAHLLDTLNTKARQLARR